MPLVIATVVTKNYLAHARVLAKSFLKYHPDGRVFVLLIDKVDGYFQPEKEPFECYNIEVLRDRIPDFDDFVFQYKPMELATAVKPFFFEFLFEKFQFKKLMFFDPDILFFGRLDPIDDLLNQYSIVLIPHITTPIDNDTRKPKEVDILQAGIYNLGFVGIRNDEITARLLEWWKKRLLRYCFSDPARGYFVDQRWMDFAPAFFEKVYFLREPGFDVAYWNLHERHVSFDRGEVLCNGKPFYFFHFSGYNPDFSHQISKHQNRFKMSEIGETKKLFENYGQLLKENGYDQVKHFPYVFGVFDNGVKIPDVARKIYWELGKKTRHFGNPFSAVAKRSFFQWLISCRGGKLPPLFQGIYESRTDIIRTFPDINGKDRMFFLDWVVKKGKREFSLSKQILELSRLFPREDLGDSVETKRNFYVFVQGIYDRLYQKPALRPILKIIKLPIRATVGIISGWRRPLSPLPGINVFGFFESEKGTGESARANVYALKAADIPYTLHNLTDSGSENIDTTFTDQFRSEAPYKINLFSVNADLVENIGRDYKPFFASRSYYNIGYWVWELSEFPSQWISAFKFFDEIWTPSNFVLDAVSKKSPIPVLRLPHSIRIPKAMTTGRYNRDYFGLPQNDFVFFFMFDFHSTLERKNPEGLIKAFKAAFSKSEPASLLIKCSHVAGVEAKLEWLKRLGRGHNIRIINAVWTRDRILSLLSLIDCYASLHRSEGFGLILAEAMALKKPVIATAYSGNMDFMNPANSYLVKYKLAALNRDFRPYKRGNVWAEPDLDHAATLLRHVYQHQDEAIRVGRRAAQDISQNFSPKAIAPLYRSRLTYITDRLARMRGR